MTQPQTQESAPAGHTAKSGWRRNLIARLLIGIPAFAGMVALLLYAPPVAIGMVLAVFAGYGIYEFLLLIGRYSGEHPPVVPMVIVGILPVFAAMVYGPVGVSGWLMVALAVATGTSLFRGPGLGAGSLGAAGLSVLALVLVSWPLAQMMLILNLPQGHMLVLFLVITLSASDTLAYFAGSCVGRHPLIPSVSPKKTVEGAVAGLLAGAVVGALAPLFMEGAGLPFDRTGMILLGTGLSLAGQAGDLLESKLKRQAGANESGRLLPGHGGLLDRWDAYMLATPLLYYILILGNY